MCEKYSVVSKRERERERERAMGTECVCHCTCEAQAPVSLPIRQIFNQRALKLTKSEINLSAFSNRRRLGHSFFILYNFYLFRTSSRLTLLQTTVDRKEDASSVASFWTCVAKNCFHCPVRRRKLPRLSWSSLHSQPTATTFLPTFIFSYKIFCDNFVKFEHCPSCRASSID